MPLNVPYALVLAIYTTLGGSFDTPPHHFARMHSYEACRFEADRIEAMSNPGRRYIAVCVRDE